MELGDFSWGPFAREIGWFWSTWRRRTCRSPFIQSLESIFGLWPVGSSVSSGFSVSIWLRLLECSPGSGAHEWLVCPCCDLRGHTTGEGPGVSFMQWIKYLGEPWKFELNSFTDNDVLGDDHTDFNFQGFPHFGTDRKDSYPDRRVSVRVGSAGFSLEES